uniref:zinc finger protein ZFAT-like n=1 Tax=Myxine glutinosa TaxID=7769 RepID=UPI00358E40A8
MGTTKIVVAVSNTEADAPSETSVSRKENSQEFSIHRVPAGGEQDNRQGTASQLQIFSCHHCGKIFKFKHSLQTHIRIHTQEKPFRCEQCDYASAIKSNLVVHQRKHTGEVFTCGSCTFTCRSRGHLKVHIERVHQQLKHNCAFCQKRYADVKNLMKHIRETHELQNKEVSACYAELQLQTRAGRRELLYTCAVCQRSFKSRLERDRHTLGHGLGPERPFVCELCGYVAGWRQGLHNHVRRHYFAYVCAFCGSFFVSATRLQVHLAEDHTDKESEPFEISLEQSFCILHPEEDQEESSDGFNFEEPKDENTMVEEQVDGHLELKGSSNVMTTGTNDAIVQGVAETSGTDTNKKGTSEQSEQLKQQPSAFRSILQELPKRSLSLALFKKLHSEFGDLECEYCGKLFWYAAHLVTHKRVHTREHPFHCPECSYTSATKNCLRRHIEQRHSAETQYCNEPSCAYSTTDKYKMQAHTRAHHFSDKTYSCPGCEKSFVDDRRFKIHVLKWHPDVPTSVLSECLGKRVQVKGGIGKRASHCPICQKLFRKGGVDLQRHIWAHQGVKPYKCQHCDYATCNQSNLRSHEERHQPDRTHLCDICGKNFRSKATLSSHKQLHSRVRRLVCGQCDYTAATKAHLQRHMEQHSTLKPFICQQCSYSCNTPSTLNRHYNQKHPGFLCAARATPSQVDAAQLAAGVIKCPICEFVYMTKWEMNRHLKNKHGMKLVQVERMRVLDANQSEASLVKVISAEEQQTEVIVEDMSTQKTTGPLPEQALELEPEAVQVLQQIVGPNESTDTITVLEQGYEVEHMVISETDGVETLTMYAPVVPMSELIVYVQEAPAEDGVAGTMGEPAEGEEEKGAQDENEGEEEAETHCERQSEPVQLRCKDGDQDVIFLKCITNRPLKVGVIAPASSAEPSCTVEEECVVGEKEEWVVCEEEEEEEEGEKEKE